MYNIDDRLICKKSFRRFDRLIGKPGNIYIIDLIQNTKNNYYYYCIKNINNYNNIILVKENELEENFEILSDRRNRIINEII